MKKYVWPIILLGMLSFVIYGCGAQSDNQDQQPASTTDVSKINEQTLTVAISGDPGADQLDAGTYNGSMLLHTMVYDGLVEYGAKGEIVPALAESWQISDDGKRYTFHLRQGVKFSDGSALDADAVKFSFERWVDNPTISLTTAKALESITVEDEHTITFVFDQAYYPLLTELAFARPVRIMSPHAVTPAGDVAGSFVAPIGTGAWIIDSYTRDQQVTLVPNPHYWGEAPLLDRLTMRVMPDAQTRLMALQSGEVDLAGGQFGKLPPEGLSVIEQDAALVLQQAPGTNSHFMIFNDDHPHLQDLAVRQAINLAINRRSIAEDVMNGIGSEANGLFPQSVPYVTADNARWYEFDREQARQKLAAAGYADSDQDGVVEKEGEPLVLKLVLQQMDFPEWKTISEFVQYELQEIGIAVELQVMEPNAYYDALWRNSDYDLILYRTYDDAYNPHSFLLSLFHHTDDAAAIVWSDEQLEQWIAEVLQTMDVQKRQQLYDKIFAKMYDEAMFAPLYFPEEIMAVRQRVSGFAHGYTTFSPIQWNKLKVGEQ